MKEEAKEKPKPLTIGERARKRYDEIRLGPLAQFAIDAEQRMRATDREKALEQYENAGGDASNEHDFHLFCVAFSHDEIAEHLDTFVPFRVKADAVDVTAMQRGLDTFKKDLDSAAKELSDLGAELKAAKDANTKNEARIAELEQALAPAPTTDAKPEGDAPKDETTKVDPKAKTEKPAKK